MKAIKLLFPLVLLLITTKSFGKNSHGFAFEKADTQFPIVGTPLIQCEDLYGNSAFTIVRLPNSSLGGIFVEGTTRMTMGCEVDRSKLFSCWRREREGAIHSVSIQKNKIGKLYAEFTARVRVDSGGWAFVPDRVFTKLLACVAQ